MLNSSRLEVAIQAAVAAGNLLEEHFNTFLTVETKESIRDIVTQVDVLAENCIIELLRELDPGEIFLTEEQGFLGQRDAKSYWVIDALDGTVNYVNNIPFFSVSIAYIENDQPSIGVIYNPLSKDLYYGADGVGAFKNQTRLVVKDKCPERALFSVAFSGKKFAPSARNNEFLLMGDINDLTQGCLRTGSASMNLAYLAEGKLGGCWGKANKFWDIAAGLVLARLAGSEVVFEKLETNNLVNYVAAVPSSWEFLHSRVSKALNLFKPNL